MVPASEPLKVTTNLNTSSDNWHGITADGSVLAVTETLLRFSRDRAKDFYSLMSSRDNRIHFTATRNQVKNILANHQTVPCLNASEADRMSNLFTNNRQLDPVTARALACGVDDACGQFFLRWFRQQERSQIVTLQPDRIFPCSAISNDRLGVIQDIAFSESTSNDYLDWLPRARLAPKYLPFDIQLDFRFEHNASVLHNPVAATFASISLPSIDFSKIDESFLIEVLDDDSAKGMFPKVVGMFGTVVPRDSYVNADDLVRLLHNASDSGATVIVFPELCASKAGIDRIEGAIRGLGPSSPVQLVIAGTSHIIDGTRRTNTQYVYFRTEDDVFGPGPNNKMSIFQFQDHERKRFVEDIDRNRKLTLLMTSAAVPIATLICKDVIEQSIVDTLRRLGVRYVFVSSMSKETTEIRINLAHLAITNNTIGVVSNTTDSGGDASIFVTPRRSSTVETKGNSPTANVCLHRIPIQPNRL